MKYVEMEYAKGPKGPAQVQTIGQIVQIVMLNKNGQPEGRAYQFGKESLGLPSIPDGVYNVSISGEGDRLYGIRPMNGSYATKFKSIASREGQLPVPKHFVGTKRNAKGESYPVDEMTFNVIAEIVSGPYKGMELVFNFLFSRKGQGFFADDLGGLNYRGGGEKGKLLVTFLEAAGIWGKSLPFSDNPLPMLDSELKRADKTFMTVLQGGWPVAFTEMPDFSQFTQQFPTPAPLGTLGVDYDLDTPQEEVDAGIAAAKLEAAKTTLYGSAVEQDGGWTERVTKSPPARPSRPTVKTAKKASAKTAKKAVARK